jgi:hypothetical protein
VVDVGPSRQELALPTINGCYGGKDMAGRIGLCSVVVELSLLSNRTSLASAGQLKLVLQPPNDTRTVLLCTVRSIISVPPLQNAVSHTTAERNGTAVVASVLQWCDSRHFAAVARLWLNTLMYTEYVWSNASLCINCLEVAWRVRLNCLKVAGTNSVKSRALGSQNPRKVHSSRRV